MAISPDLAAELVTLVRHVAQAEIMPRFRTLGPESVRAKSRPDDLVTDADLAAEAALAEGIGRLMPSAKVVGEEAVSQDASVLDGIAAAETCVIVDPVDGTWNFAAGLPLFGVILAVVERGQTTFGLLYDPVMDDWVSAHRGGGAWLERPDAAPVRLLRLQVPRTAEEMVGFASLALFPTAQQVALAAATPRFRRLTSLRCSCHEYRLLARGSADFVLSAGLNAWDHAAGVLIAEETGGHAALLGGASYSPILQHGQMLVAASAAAHQTARAVLPAP